MTIALMLVVVLGAVLAYANGANDVSKGIATLVGSGVTDYRRAILWGTLWTAAGAMAGAHLGGAMVARFGNGLLASGQAPTFTAALAVLAAAALWVLIATRAGMAVSTTHAIVGALVGVALVERGVDGVQWSALGGLFLLPLLASPLAALACTMLVSPLLPSGSADCMCAHVEAAPVVALATPNGAAIAPALPGTVRLRVARGASAACTAERPAALRITVSHFHWLTSGATSFARGLNDAPKIVALGVAAAAASPSAGLSSAALFALVATAMAAGSAIAGRRVTRVLAERVTRLGHHEGFVANAVAAALVGAGAHFGLPMSTTHVSAGGIAGAGVRRGARALDLTTVRNMALAWVVTLPGAASLGMFAYGFATLAPYTFATLARD